MASSIVIKVKYEDTLRRFNANVTGGQLEITMEGLRTKICSLFNFPPSVDFSLTYIDEDKDVVTLADDEDLDDVITQGLDPIRITVHVNTEKSPRSCAKSSGSSTPVRLPSQNSPQHINPVVADLKSALNKLSHELTSKASSSSPIVADFIGIVSKMGESYLNAYSPSRMGMPYVSTDDEVSGKSEDTSRASGNIVVHVDDGKNANVQPDNKNKDKEIIGNSAGNARCNEVKAKPEKHCSTEKKSFEAVLGEIKGLRCGGNSSKSTVVSNHVGECPFSGIPLPPPLPSQGFYKPPTAIQPPLNSMGNIFHKGVRCDGCGVLPITGPRFKSKVKHDYDLCNICFTRMGNDGDYSRIDFPIPYRHPWQIKGFSNPMVIQNHPLQVPSMMRPHVAKHPRSRLQSRFVMDVNVMDGTMMAPSTPFTKIWRMRNNGSLPWTRGLQLVWIGGDRFNASDSVEIEIPVDGVNVGNELDIAVDFTAPELPGQYISYWRMAEPSGHKFGQRVWVLIQVDASLTDSTRESSPNLNLNMPPSNGEPEVDVEANDHNNPGRTAEKESVVEQKCKIEIEDLNFPINDDLLVSNDGLGPISSTPSSPFQNIPPPVNAGSLALGHFDGPNVYNLPADAHPVPYPVIDVTYESNATSSNAKAVEENAEGVGEKDEKEETLLKELEEMGFKQVGLNKEVLRMNEYDLERSVDDLCGVSEWDPLLEELKEMGFQDKETNKKLLVKNNGSIMRVVMDLIAGEKGK